VLAKHYRPGPDSGHGPSWLTFIGHLKDSLWSTDLFRCERPTPLRGHKSENNRRPDENGAQYDQAHTGAEAESTLVLKCPFESVVRG
jgi:hypothetical protein